MYFLRAFLSLWVSSVYAGWWVESPALELASLDFFRDAFDDFYSFYSSFSRSIKKNLLAPSFLTVLPKSLQHFGCVWEYNPLISIENAKIDDSVVGDLSASFSSTSLSISCLLTSKLFNFLSWLEISFLTLLSMSFSSVFFSFSFSGSFCYFLVYLAFWRFSCFFLRVSILLSSVDMSISM